MTDALLEHGGRSLDEARDIARRINHSIPGATTQGAEIPGPIAIEPFGVGEQIRVRAPAVEERHVVPTVQCRLDDVASEKECPTED